MLFPGRLDAAQRQALAALAPLGGSLSGGAALVGVWLGHRTTKDLDIFFHGRPTLDRQVDDAVAALTAAGMSVEVQERYPGFARLLARSGKGATLVDLVAERVPFVAAPVEVQTVDGDFLVDPPHEILVNKLCTLLSRSEPRDLFDVRALLEAGGELERALGDATRKEAGMSGPTLAWILGTLRVAAAGPVLGLDGAEVDALTRFRDELADRVVRLSTPG